MKRITLSSMTCCLLWLTSLAQQSPFTHLDKQNDTPFTKVVTRNNNDTQPLRCMGLEEISNSEALPEAIERQGILKDGKIAIAFFPSGNITLLHEELKAIGVTNTTLRFENKVITGMLPLDLVPLIDNCKYLETAMPTYKAELNFGRTKNQAGSAMLADRISAQLGFTGQGVKIGIISDTFNVHDGLDVRVQNGDLPGKENPNGFTKDVTILRESNISLNSARDEGRAMAELIHDIAPEAELYFYGASDGYFELNDAILALEAAGCDIIVDDLTYREAPVYQDGLVAHTVNQVVARGVSYFTSAGNGGVGGFEAPYNNRALVNNQGEFLGDFFANEAGRIFRLMLVPANSTLSMTLQWESPSRFSAVQTENDPIVTTDLNMRLRDFFTGRHLIVSADVNKYTGLPLERFFYRNRTDEDQIVRFEIYRSDLGDFPERLAYFYRASSDEFRIETIEGQERQGTIYGHEAAKGAIAVGAMQYTHAPEFGGTPLLEEFSSYGGLAKTLDLAGNPMPREVRRKPDIVAPDGVNNTSFGSLGERDLEGDGFRNFFGTSAAAPNAAAVAALLLEANPNLTPEDIKAVLTQTALDMDDPLTPNVFEEGFDFATGYGLVQADKAIANVINQPIVYRVELVDAETKALIDIVAPDEIIDLAEVTSAVDLNLLSEHTKRIHTTFSGPNFLVKNEGRETPFLVVDADNTSNAPWEAQSGDYLLRWLALGDDKAVKDSNFTIFHIINSNFDKENLHTSKLVRGLVATPNPVSNSGIITLKISEGSAIASYKLFDKSGVELFSGTNNVIDTSELQSGIYIVTVKDITGKTYHTKVSVL